MYVFVFLCLCCQCLCFVLILFSFEKSLCVHASSGFPLFLLGVFFVFLCLCCWCLCFALFRFFKRSVFSHAFSGFSFSFLVCFVVVLCLCCWCLCFALFLFLKKSLFSIRILGFLFPCWCFFFSLVCVVGVFVLCCSGFSKKTLFFRLKHFNVCFNILFRSFTWWVGSLCVIQNFRAYGLVAILTQGQVPKSHTLTNKIGCFCAYFSISMGSTGTLSNRFICITLHRAACLSCFAQHCVSPLLWPG